MFSSLWKGRGNAKGSTTVGNELALSSTDQLAVQAHDILSDLHSAATISLPTGTVRTLLSIAESEDDLDMTFRTHNREIKGELQTHIPRTRRAVQSLTDQLVAYYPLNGNANDVSGNGHHGVVYGATLAQDRHGNDDSAYSFDGVGNYIKIIEEDSFDVVNEITIAAWIYRMSNAP